MRHSLKRTLAALGAVSAILLGLAEVGVTPVAPGVDTGLETVRVCRAGALCLETDAGDLPVLVKLRFGPTRGPAGAWKADLSNGTRLDVRVEPTPGPGHTLLLTHADSAESMAKFVWPSGVALRVWNERAPIPRLGHWRIIPEKGGYDSTGRARWRTVWFAVSLVLLFVGVAAAATEFAGGAGGPAAPPQEPSVRSLAEELLRLTIAGVQGGNAEETRLVQQLLSSVLLGTLTVRQATEQVVPGWSASRQQQLFHTARARFVEQWTKVIEILSDYGNQLH